MPRKDTPHRISNKAAEEYGIDKKGRVNRRAMSDETWDKLVESFRQYPGDVTRARKHADVAYNTARKAWEEGGKRNPNRPPIKEIVATEAVELRAQLTDLKRQTTVDRKTKAIKAKDDIQDDKALEQALLRSARTNSRGLLAVSGRLIRTAMRLLAFVDKQLEDPKWKPDAAEAIGMISKIVRLAHTANEAAGVTTRMQKDILGGPEVLVQVAQMTPEAALEAVEHSARTLKRLRSRMSADGLSAEVTDVVDVTALAADGTVDVSAIEAEAVEATATAVGNIDTSLLGEDGTVDLGKAEQDMVDDEDEQDPPTRRPTVAAREVAVKPSSNIAGALYDDSTLGLWVTFHSGRTYRYADVPRELVDEWERARSTGEFFGAAIKNGFAVERIDD